MMGPPGFDGRFELGIMEVPDPFEPDKMLTVPCNVRHDVVLSLYRNGGISYAQYRAGNDFLALLERAEVCRGLVCDPAKEPVDGGRGGVELSDDRARAARDLQRMAECIGARDYHFARSILGTSISFWGYRFSFQKMRRTTKTFKEILVKVARHLNLDGERCACVAKMSQTQHLVQKLCETQNVVDTATRISYISYSGENVGNDQDGLALPGGSHQSRPQN